ncbi:hypothetical protein CHCC14821_2614 [Bacillus paralicheniformis]|nr:hypothetical protein CHCC14821_2614 [Bacillus paralicheniformis]
MTKSQNKKLFWDFVNNLNPSVSQRGFSVQAVFIAILICGRYNYA